MPEREPPVLAMLETEALSASPSYLDGNQPTGLFSDPNTSQLHRLAVEEKLQRIEKWQIKGDNL